MSKLSLKPYILRDNDRVLDSEDRPYIFRVRDLPLSEKPRERLMALGPKGLTTAELTAVIFGTGTKREEVMVMARRVLKDYGEKAILNETNPSRLAEALDIPVIKACQLIASFELGRRFFAESGGRPVFVRSAKQAHFYLREMGSLKKEQLRGLYLNSRYQVIHDETISLGSLTANIVHPREVFRPAIEQGAAAVIIAHNHPSGSLVPTDSDLTITRQLVEAGQLLGIDLLDHLIIAGHRFVSLMEDNGKLQR